MRDELKAEFSKQGWSDPFIVDGKFWGFSPGNVMPTPIPQKVARQGLGNSYKPPFRDSLSALRNRLASIVIPAMATVSVLAFIPFLVPSSTLYQIRSSEGGKPLTQYETNRRPYMMGSTIYLWCNGGIASVSGDTPHIVINADRSDKDETVTICK